MRGFRGIFLPLVGLAGLALAGCGPDLDAICLAREDCLGGNDADIEACVAIYEAAIEVADIEGCESEYDEYFACYESSADCHSEDTGVMCGSSEDCTGNQSCKSGTCRNKYFGIEIGEDDCEVESSALGRCL